MRIGAADERPVKLPRQIDVVRISAFPAQQHRVFLARHRLAHGELLEFRLDGNVHAASMPHRIDITLVDPRRRKPAPLSRPRERSLRQPCHHARTRRRQSRPRRHGPWWPRRCRWLIEPREPPLQRSIAAIPRRRRRLIVTLRLTRWTPEMHMHVRRMPIPRPHQMQPLPIRPCRNRRAELLLDRRIDQHPIHPRQRRRHPDQLLGRTLPPRRVHATAIRADQAFHLHPLALHRRERRLGPRIEPNVGIEPNHVARMQPHHRPAMRQRDIVHVQRAHPGLLRLARQQLDRRDRRRRPPE